MRLTVLDHKSKEKIKVLVDSAAELHAPLPNFIMELKRNLDKA